MASVENSISFHYNISLFSMHLKSDLIFGRNSLLRGVAFGRSSFLRGVAFGRSSLLRGVAFGRSSLLRGVTFGRSSLLRRMTFGRSSLLRGGLLYNFRNFVCLFFYCFCLLFLNKCILINKLRYARPTV